MEYKISMEGATLVSEEIDSLSARRDGGGDVIGFHSNDNVAQAKIANRDDMDKLAVGAPVTLNGTKFKVSGFDESRGIVFFRAAE